MEKEENRTRKLKVRRTLQEKGITLVALVVTIIILLILAGVTLNLALGEGGIFARAKNTADRYQAAQANELDQLTQLEEMLNNYGQGETGTGGTGDPTPPSGGTDSSEVSEKLKQYQGKYVDIGLDTNGNTKVDDWELFYATTDRIFLIAADYMPVAKLTEWGILGAETTLGSNGFISYGTYNVYWGTSKTFLGLPNLDVVMHNGYSLTDHQAQHNAIAVSHLLNTDAWSGIKNAASKKASIDFVIGGPTLEMWCAAWKEAVKEDSVLKPIEADPQTSGSGYNVKYNGTSNTYMHVNGITSSAPASTKLDEYKTFFPHTGRGGSDYNGCYGYLLASPSAYDSDCLMQVTLDGNVGGDYYNFGNYCVRPVVSLASGVQIVERADAENIYDLVE